MTHGVPFQTEFTVSRALFKNDVTYGKNVEVASPFNIVAAMLKGPYANFSAKSTLLKKNYVYGKNFKKIKRAHSTFWHSGGDT